MRTITITLLLLIANTYIHKEICLGFEATFKELVKPQKIHGKYFEPSINVLYVTQIRVSSKDKGTLINDGKSGKRLLNLGVTPLNEDEVRLKMDLIQDIEKRMADLGSNFNIIQDLKAKVQAGSILFDTTVMIETLEKLKIRIESRNEAEQETNKANKLIGGNNLIMSKLHEHIGLGTQMSGGGFNYNFYDGIAEELTENRKMDERLLKDTANLMNIIISVEKIKDKISNGGDQQERINEIRVLKDKIADFYQSQLLIQERALKSPKMRLIVDESNKSDDQFSSNTSKQQTSDEYNFEIQSNRGLMKIHKSYVKEIPRHMIPILIYGDQYDLCKQLFDEPIYEKWPVKHHKLKQNIIQTCCFNLRTEIRKSEEQIESEQKEALPKQFSLDTYFLDKFETESAKFNFEEIDNIDDVLIILEEVDNFMYNEFKIKMYLPQLSFPPKGAEQLKTLHMLI